MGVAILRQAVLAAIRKLGRHRPGKEPEAVLLCDPGSLPEFLQGKEEREGGRNK